MTQAQKIDNPATELAPAVYEAIRLVQGELAKIGISKDGVNESQKYKFRGIDQVYGALSPLLAKHGLCVLPRIISREMNERITIKEWNGQKKESVLFYVTVEAEFDFVAVADGSRHTVRTYGEAMDSGDKATNKAMSAAYKYAAFMAFAIPTEGDNDADGHTYDVEPRQGPAPRTKLEGPHTSKTALRKAVIDMITAARKCDTVECLNDILRNGKDTIAQAERDWPALLNGDPSIEEDIGLKGTVAEIRAKLQRSPASILINQMKDECATVAEMGIWWTTNEEAIEQLEDADRDRFDTAYMEYESALQTASLTRAG